MQEKIQSQIDRLYRSQFKDGELVVVEDDNGDFHWGKLETGDESIKLKRPGRAVELFWDEILFIAHDGFPVKRIRGMSEETATILAEQTDTDAIRAVLSLPGGPKDCERDGCVELVHYPPHNPCYCSEVCFSNRRFEKSRFNLSPGGYMGGGCPFSFEFESAILLNRGQVGNWGEDTEEVAILTAKDGATCHVSYLQHHFLEW